MVIKNLKIENIKTFETILKVSNEITFKVKTNKFR